MTKIVCVSDIHCRHKKITIPDCDILISTGDYTFMGRDDEVRDFHKWLDKQPAKHIISGQGNHEKGVEANFSLSKQLANSFCPRAIFIDEGLVELENLSIWYSAITPYFCNWAWNRFPGEDIQKHWDRIPQVDIIATHGPCYGILDYIPSQNKHVGCPQLLQKVLEIKPKIHCGGHIHEGRGIVKQDNIQFINSSICDEDYKAIHSPIEIVL